MFFHYQQKRQQSKERRKGEKQLIDRDSPIAKVN